VGPKRAIRTRTRCDRALARKDLRKKQNDLPKDLVRGDRVGPPLARQDAGTAVAKLMTISQFSDAALDEMIACNAGRGGTRRGRAIDLRGVFARSVRTDAKPNETHRGVRKPACQELVQLIVKSKASTATGR